MVDCSRGTADPRATGMLADYGADVVWVEPPGGDPLQRGARRKRSRSSTAASASVELDLHDGALHEPLLVLIDHAEIFVESWRPGVADRLGLGYDQLHTRNPALVYVSISGFGEDSAVDLPGFEPLVQAVLGSMSDQVGRGRSDLPRVPVRRRRRGIARLPRCARRSPPSPRRRSRSPRPDLPARRRPGLPLDDVGRERHVDRVP